MTTSLTDPPDSQQRRYWRRVLRLTGALLLIWFVVTFGGVFFARDLGFHFFGWPFGFWLAAQGAVIGYVVLDLLWRASLREYQMQKRSRRDSEKSE